MLQMTGERQVGTILSDIREDHKERYIWVADRIQPNTVVLDAGCGIGYGSNILAEKAERVISIDISIDAIEYAQKYWDNKKIIFEQQDLHFLTYKKKHSLDCITAFEVIEHIISPQLFLRAAHKLLKPNGKIFLSVPNEKVIPHTVELNPFHIRHFTTKEISKLLKSNGYKVISIYSQDDSEVLDGSNGRFLIVEATPTQVSSTQTRVQLADYQGVIKRSNELLMERATLISKYKKDIRSLKTRFESSNARSKDIAGLNDSNLNNLLNQIQSLTSDLKESLVEQATYKERSTNPKETIDLLLEKNTRLESQSLQNDENIKKLKNDISNLNVQIEDISAKSHAVIKQNKILVHTNQDLAHSLESIKNDPSVAKSVPKKEPPSIGYMGRKLKHHRFYIPFLLKAIRNSLGFNPRKKQRKKA